MRGDRLEYTGFITTGTGGDLAIVFGSDHFFLPKQGIRHLLFSGQEMLLLLPGGIIDAESKVSACRTSNLGLIIVCGRTFFLRWSDFVEVASGDVQWAPLKPSPEGAVP